jgi:mRNA-degrading endonuclease toxin of MazEF toxin-antitoxin module
MPSTVVMMWMWSRRSRRLRDVTGRVDPHELAEIDTALRGVLGLF